MTKLKVRELSPYLGAEIDGLHPQAPSDETWRELSRLFDKYGVLVFRDIEIDSITQHRVVDVLYAGGAPEAAKAAENSRFSYVSNKEADGGAPYGRLLFHADMMWSEIAQQVPSLYAVEAQQPSTPTTFVSATYAWNTLPEELKRRVKGLRARHESGQQGRGNSTHEEELIQPKWDKLRDTIKPVVMPHPRTRQNMLYVCEQQTREIVDLPQNESDELLDALFAHLYRPDRIVPHHWRTGDLVVWDNQAIQHGRPYVQGDGPARTLRKIHAPGDIIQRLGQGPAYDMAAAAQ
jgi:alpha-ketoglutarate-dependent taurine dioxygenase